VPRNTAPEIQLWNTYVRPVLGRQAARQFCAATDRQDNAFRQNFVGPQLYAADHNGDGTYVPISTETTTLGRNHYLAEYLAGGSWPWASDDPFDGATYFANVLSLTQPLVDPETGSEDWEPPSRRIVLGDQYAFTLEFDYADPEFLALQLSWLRSPKNPTDSLIGQFYLDMTKFTDFAGITVNYSGGKSLHVHVVFNLGLAKQSLGLLHASSIRDGLITHWHELHRLFLAKTALTGVTADTATRLPEQYRRLPNGCREIDSDTHILGIPKGTIVPQVTLWERWVKQAGAGADVGFLKPQAFFQTSATAPRQDRPNRAPARKFNKVLTPEEMDFCERQLRHRYGDYPKYSHLTHERGQFVAYFYNSPDDQKPSSVMRGDHRTILLQGHGAEKLKPRALSLPLDAMIKLWLDQLHSNSDTPWEEVVLADPTKDQQPRRPEELAFAEQAVNHEAASKAIRGLLRTTAMTVKRPALICAPEGIRKTSSLFADHNRIQTAIELECGGERIAMYAFADYETAAEKCEAFNTEQRVQAEVRAKRSGAKSRRKRSHGVLVPSFSRAYEEACAGHGLTPITVEDAAAGGYRGVWEAMAVHQRAVLDALKARHAAMWRELNGKKPVFFTVHDVAQSWHLTSPTRVMWDERFWIGRMDDKTHVRDCRKSTALGLLVHDEVAADDLVVLRRAEVIAWADGLRASDPAIWSGRRSNLAAQHASYLHYRRTTPLPVVCGEQSAISFSDVRGILGLGNVRWETTTTVSHGEYGEYGEAEDDTNDIYRDRIGRHWAVASLDWWRGAAGRVIVLTTEAVPTAVARRLGTWEVFDLETPKLHRDIIDAYPERSITGRQMANVITEYRKRPGAASRTVISNRAKMLENTVTHKRARGSNAYIGQDLAQTMSFFPPEQYEQLEALNVWTGRRDIVRLAHIDQLNQSAGRNLGFRRQGDVIHDLLINRRLLGLLMNDVLARSRYEFRAHLGREARYRLRHRPA
jgi:hypothetical protein